MAINSQLFHFSHERAQKDTVCPWCEAQPGASCIIVKREPGPMVGRWPHDARVRFYIAAIGEMEWMNRHSKDFQIEDWKYLPKPKPV